MTRLTAVVWNHPHRTSEVCLSLGAVPQDTEPDSDLQPLPEPDPCWLQFQRPQSTAACSLQRQWGGGTQGSSTMRLGLLSNPFSLLVFTPVLGEAGVQGVLPPGPPQVHLVRKYLAEVSPLYSTSVRTRSWQALLHQVEFHPRTPLLSPPPTFFLWLPLGLSTAYVRGLANFSSLSRNGRTRSLTFTETD